jgi:hypothetical protein
VYHDARGERRSAGTFSNKKDADKAWQKAELRLAEGRLGDPRRGRQTFRRYQREMHSWVWPTDRGGQRARQDHGSPGAQGGGPVTVKTPGVWVDPGPEQPTPARAQQFNVPPPLLSADRPR